MPGKPAGTISCFAPAKINLALHVVGRRADGYHLLDTMVMFAQAGDRITVENSDEDGFSVIGPFTDHVPANARNLVLRARDALRATAVGHQAVHIRLEKNLPVASGIGGGSSDAAATLRALNKLWNAGVSQTDMARLGLSLGADLPMCLLARPARVTGIGENLIPLSSCPSFHAVLVNPGVAVSTPDVFSRLGSRDNAPLPVLPTGAHTASWLDWLSSTRSDLQPAAISAVPLIANVLAELERTNAALARMSGSGATCFGIFQTNAEAGDAAQAIRERHPDWYVQETQLTGSDE